MTTLIIIVAIAAIAYWKWDVISTWAEAMVKDDMEDK